MNDNIVYSQDMFDEAAEMVDRYAKKHGFGRKDPRWEKLYKRYLNETVESLRPGVMSNPQVSKRVIEAAYTNYYDTDYSFIAKKLGKSERSRELMNRLESAVNNLNAIFLEVNMDLKTKAEGKANSDFDMPAGANLSQKSETWHNQYKRMTSLSLFYAALFPIFELTTKADIIAIMGASNLKTLSPEQMHTPENRVGYSKELFEFLKPFFRNQVNFKSIILGEAHMKKQRSLPGPRRPFGNPKKKRY